MSENWSDKAKEDKIYNLSYAYDFGGKVSLCLAIIMKLIITMMW